MDEFPAFFTRASGCAAPARVDTPRQAAALIKAGRCIPSQSCILSPEP